MVKDHGTRLRDGIRHNLVDIAGSTLPCPGDNANLVAIVPYPVTVTMRPNHHPWDGSSGSRPRMSEIAKHNRMSGCFQVASGSCANVVSKIVKCSIDFKV